MDGLMLDTERVEITACKAAADELGYDMTEDLILSTAAGMHPILVPDMKPPCKEIAALAMHVFPSLVQVRDHFQRMFEG